MPSPIKAAIIGTGFMGRVHLEAVRRLGSVEVAAIAGSNAKAAEALGAEFCIPKIVSDYGEVLRDPAIDALHICTPNNLHFPMAKAAIEAGKHLICEKPLATTAREGEELVTLAAAKKIRNSVCHNLRFYPMVQQMRAMREAGDLGEILVVQGTYFQDWLLHHTDWNWRVDAKLGGPSRCMADIGSHWFDMAEHITGLRVSSLCSDLQTFHVTRKRPTTAAQTFSATQSTGENYTEPTVDTEDYGAVLFHMAERTRGSMSASQVSAGRKNRLSIEIGGTRSYVSWSQERPDELWIGHRDHANQLLLKDPSLLKPSARTYADLPGGHSEGYDDTFKQVFRRFYDSIRNPDAAPEYPQFADGLRQLNILEAVMQSNQTRRWTDVAPAQPAPERHS